MKVSNIHQHDTSASLKYAKFHIANYAYHPSYEFKQQQLAAIEKTEALIRASKKIKKAADSI